MATTVLDSVTPASVRTDLRTPYIHIQNAVPTELATRLRETFPAVEVMTSGRVGARRVTDGVLPVNKKITLYFDEVLDSPDVAPEWKELVRDHASYELFMSFVHLFEDELFARSPSLKEYLKDVTSDDVGLTGRPEHAGRKILIDGGLSLDTPGDPTSKPVIHLDNPRRIANILWYIRDEDDVSPGGNLEFYAPKSSPLLVNEKMMVYPEHHKNLDKIGEISFDHNTMFVFLNSPTAFHGVQPRPVFRRSLNLGFLVNYDLHDMSAVQENTFQKLWRKITKA